MHMLIPFLLTAVIVIGVAIVVGTRRARRPRKALRKAIGGLVTFNGLVVLVCVGLVVLSLSAPTLVRAEEPAAGASGGTDNTAMAAAVTIGVACVAAGIAVAVVGAAAVGGITEKPEIFGRALIFVGLAEGIAIYGLIIAFMILNR